MSAVEAPVVRPAVRPVPTGAPAGAPNGAPNGVPAGRRGDRPLVRPDRPAPPAAPAVPAARPTLQVVRPPAQGRTRVPFVMLCIGLLGASLVGTLLLNTSMAQGEYDRFALQTELVRSAQEQQRLLQELEHVSAPAQIAEAAGRLGMVPATSGGYLRLSDGAVLGEPTPAGTDG